MTAVVVAVVVVGVVAAVVVVVVMLVVVSLGPGGGGGGTRGACGGGAWLKPCYDPVGTNAQCANPGTARARTVPVHVCQCDSAHIERGGGNDVGPGKVHRYRKGR